MRILLGYPSQSLGHFFLIINVKRRVMFTPKNNY